MKENGPSEVRGQSEDKKGRRDDKRGWHEEVWDLSLREEVRGWSGLIEKTRDPGT